MHDLGITVLVSSSMHEKRQFSSTKCFTFWIFAGVQVEMGFPGCVPLQEKPPD